MSRKQQIAAVAAPLILCTVVLLILSHIAIRHRTFVPQAVLQQVASPESSFPIWQEYNLHGRILVLIDRRLNAEDDIRTSLFYADEFTSRAALDTCCSVLRSDIQTATAADFPCTLEGLNTMIGKRLVLYPLFLQSRLTDTAGQITRLAGYMSYPSRIDLQMTPAYEEAVPLLNRLILDRVNPGGCPPLSEFPVSAGNYLHQAVRAGIVRKVYHLISDNAWEEVSAGLRGYGDKVVRSSKGKYRIAIAEGVPVWIMRLRDMPDPGEPAVVLVNTDSITRQEVSLLPEYIKRTLRADVITVLGSGSVDVLKTLEAAYATPE